MSHNWQGTHSALGEPIYICTQCRQQYTGLDLRQWFGLCAGPDTSAYHAALIRYARGEGRREGERGMNGPDVKALEALAAEWEQTAERYPQNEDYRETLKECAAQLRALLTATQEGEQT